MKYCLFLVCLLCGIVIAHAQAPNYTIGYTPLANNPPAGGYTQMSACDDCFIQVDLPFRYIFGKKTYDHVFIGTNGIISFDAGSWESIPDSFPRNMGPVIAPFWSDVDTRGASYAPQGLPFAQYTNKIWYLADLHKFKALWNYVGYYSAMIDKANKFGVELVDNTIPVTNKAVPPATVPYDLLLSYDTIAWYASAVTPQGKHPVQGWDMGDGVHYFNAPNSRTLQPLGYPAFKNAYSFQFYPRAALPAPSLPSTPAPPVIRYPDSLLFFVGSAVPPIAPTVSGGAIPAGIYGRVTTYAGTGSMGQNSTTRAASSFNRPMALTVDPAENLLVGDYGNNLLRKIPPAYVKDTVMTLFSDTTTGGIAVDAAGNIYRTNMMGNKAVRTDENNQIAIPYGVIPGFLYSQPGGIAVDTMGNVYIADRKNNRIAFSTASGTATAISRGLMNPIYAGSKAGLAGTANAADTNARFNNPTGILRTPQGDLYVADYGNNQIRKIVRGATNQVSLYAGDPLGAAGYVDGPLSVARFNRPYALTMDAAGNIMVADQGNNVIRMISRNGYVTTLAGSGAAGNKDTGAARLATFNGIAGIAADRTGNLFVADTGSHKVRAVALTGFSIVPDLPAGLTFDYATGTISGTPLVPTGPTRYYITAYNTGGSSTDSILLATPMLAASDDVFCSREKATVYALPAASGLNWKWRSGNCSGTLLASGDTAHLVTDDDTYYYASADGFTACGRVLVLVSKPPVITLPPTGCTGMQLAASVSLPAYQIRWMEDNTVVSLNLPTWTGNAVTAAGSASGASGSSLSLLNNPTHSQLDVAGNLYISEAGNHRVTKWAPGATSGVVVAGGNGAGSNANQLNSPLGICLDMDDNLYVADFNNGRVQKWAPGATSGVTVAGVSGNPGTAANQLQFPAGVTVDSNRILYVADCYNHRIQKWLPGASSGITVAGSSTGQEGSSTSYLSYPLAVRTDRQGNLYIADNSNHRVMKWAPGASSGTVVAGNGIAGNAADQLNVPADLEVDKMGTVYIADRKNHRIQRWRAGAASGTTIAGTGASGSGAAQLSNPYGVRMDASGNLYVSDRANNRIQRFSMKPDTVFTPPYAGVYRVMATNLHGCTSLNDTVVVYDRAAITAQPPASGSVCLGNPVSLTGSASNTIAYQWMKDNITLSGAYANAYMKQGSLLADAGNYRLIAIGEGGCNDTSAASVVMVNNPASALPLTNTSVSYLQTDGLSYHYSDTACSLLASIADAAGGNTLGTTLVKVSIDSVVKTFRGQPYLQRHYDIQPASNGAATVKLYVRQQEFDAFNNYITANNLTNPRLPAGPADYTGMANISITQYHGLPSAGTTGPGGQYNVSQQELIPNSRITRTWNGSYWTLSFPVNGFSGFYISSGSATALPITLNDIAATNQGTSNLISWNSASEDADDYYEVERSLDAAAFMNIATVKARYVQGGSYELTDQSPGTGINYYRLKMLHADGSATYSRVVSAVVKNGTTVIEAFPNPVQDELTVRIHRAVASQATISLIDATGQILLKRNADAASFVLSTRELASGTYLLHYQDGYTGQSVRIVKR